ncbi:MAG: YceH family protein [Nitrospirota bacterium]
MDIVLSEIEVRILGCLIEKETTTPDYYPLTLNSLVNACNQKSNRNPVVSYEETSVVRGLDSLQDKGFSEKIYKADSRVPKYGHLFMKKLNLSRSEAAVLCVLMMRGPQTNGEIRGRSERIYKFNDLGEVEKVLDELMNKEHPMAIKLPRQVGRKESRFMHLLSGEPDITESPGSLPQETATQQVRAENERIVKLEEEVEALRKELGTLQKEFNDLKSQFE